MVIYTVAKYSSSHFSHSIYNNQHNQLLAPAFQNPSARCTVPAAKPLPAYGVPCGGNGAPVLLKQKGSVMEAFSTFSVVSLCPLPGALPCASTLPPTVIQSSTYMASVGRKDRRH